jgi:asparagine synthase (glutamine-hydrolysing)
VSGFAGILHIDGTPADRALIERLTEFQKFRGPDGQNVWVDGSVAFGHTLLKISPESELERQPLSLDGQTWIVADCRVDARLTLITELEKCGQHALAGSPDAELILRAYTVWGGDCVHRLLGDYSFAIWDGLRGRLFCARDQMGVKPFFYAHIGSRLIFSNTLACVRRHPAVSNDLNDLAIADFLLFDMIQERGATSFRDIQRLPAAHTLTCTEGKVSTSRYWTLRVSEAIAHEDQRECVDQFRELLDTAIADRLRTNGAGVMMSGGLDSATVAASAQKKFSHHARQPGLRAYTEVFDTLIPHEERHYAGLVAEALNIPIEFQTSDHFGLWKYLDGTETRFSEPLHSPWSDWGFHQLRQVAQTRRVALTGYGGDPSLSCLLTIHFRELLKKLQLGRIGTDVVRYLRAEGRFSRLYFRARWRRWFTSKGERPHYPEWLNQDLEKRLCLRERWQTLTPTHRPNETARQAAYQAMVHPLWPSLFELSDAGATRAAVEVRHPFFDLRLIKFLLALPALPWCSDKELIREAGRGVLPEAVRLRRKSPLLADPLIALLRRPESMWVDSFAPCAELAQYVQRNRIPKVFREKNAWNAWIHLRPLSLNFWLRSKDPSGINALGAAGDADSSGMCEKTVPRT